MAKAKKNNYDAKDIQVLEGLDAVRKRPGMYIGGTDVKALHHMVYEITDNAVDEKMAGECDTLTVTINKDQSISISDNGRGIPVGEHPVYKVSALELILTKLHSGGKFGGGGYKMSGGLHGVGLSVVNALSEFLDIEVKRDGFKWTYKLKRGVAVSPVKKGAKTKETGTTITFKPDKEIFEETEFNSEILLERFKEISYLNKGLKILFTDARCNPIIEETLFYEGGVIEYVNQLNSTKKAIHPKIVYFETPIEKGFLECGFQYCDDYSETINSFVNNIRTIDGGTHEIGFKSALSKAFNEIAREKKVLKDKDSNLTAEDLREGLVAIINLKIEEPQFEGQTKGKLTNTEVKGLVEKAVYEALCQHLKENKSTLTNIVRKAKEAARIREQMKQVRMMNKKKNELDSGQKPSKLANCSSKNPVECEIYLVEGDSAGGSAKSGRNRQTQAILPLRGKVLNAERYKLSKLLQNAEIQGIIASLGGGVDKDFDVKRLRYHKIIIMTDADVDGEHIVTLLLTFFYRYMRPLIDRGMLYIAQPPLYKITYKLKNKNQVVYAYSDDEKDSIIKKLKVNYEVQRYKGLGEMNPDQLWETTMNPATRTLIQVTEENAAFSDEIFTMLMGQSVEPRKDFIMINSDKFSE